MDINRNWVPRNEYTTPLTGTVDYKVSGIIKAIDENGEKISVGRIDYERFINEEFQYTITPFWSIIDNLSSLVFQGIPGIDADLRLEKYYRTNYEPVFITQRTPPRNRVDLKELLDMVDMDYYERLEWLIRTDLTAGDDNLIVERARDYTESFEVSSYNKLRSILGKLQYDDVVRLNNITALGRKPEVVASTLTKLMYYGVRLILDKEEIDINPEKYKEIIPIMALLNDLYMKERTSKQTEGIEKSKQAGAYKGRKKIQVDEPILRQAFSEYKNGLISLKQAMEISGMKSKSTFYRRLKELN